MTRLDGAAEPQGPLMLEAGGCVEQSRDLVPAEHYWQVARM